MKLICVLLILLPVFVLSQPNDSVKKEAIRLQILAFDAEKRSQFDSAILLADSSIAFDNTRREPYTIKAESLWLSRRFKEAAETYKKRLAVEQPQLVIGAYVLLGMLYDKAGNRKAAKEQYLLAINTWENGYQIRSENTKWAEGEYKWERIEYFIAFGLLRDKRRWKQKLPELKKKYPALETPNYEKMSRKELLEHHFRSYGG
jgi:hypothetical protein